jgi:hypothetical protein
MKQVSNAALRKRAQRERQRAMDPEYLAKNAAYAKAYRERKLAAAIHKADVVPQQAGGAQMKPADVKQTADALFEYSQVNDTGDRVIKEKTALDYAKRLLFLTRMITGDSTASIIDLELFRDVDRVWAAIVDGRSAKGRHQPWSISSKIAYMGAITGALRRAQGFAREYAEYSKKFATLQKQYDEERKTNRLTATEEKKFIPWPTLKRIWRAEVSNINATQLSMRDLAIISLYVGIAPRRIADYQLMYITDDDSDLRIDRNYLLIEGGKVAALIFNTYKTSDRYGTYRIDNIPADVARVLTEYVRVAGLSAGNLLFPTRSAKPYTNGAFSNLIGTIFKNLTGQRVTVNILRHSAISNFLDKKRSVAEKHAYGLRMGHSIAMQSLYDRVDAPADSGATKLTRTQRRRAARKAAKLRART